MGNRTPIMFTCKKKTPAFWAVVRVALPPFLLSPFTGAFNAITVPFLSPKKQPIDLSVSPLYTYHVDVINMHL